MSFLFGIIRAIFYTFLLTSNCSCLVLHMKKEKNSKNSKNTKNSKYDGQPLYSPKTTNQKQYFDVLNDENNKLIFANGPAGTGKTLFACLKAIDLLKKGDITKIIITRPMVTVEEEVGFLPGTLIRKMDPWTKPIFDIFLEYYSQHELNTLINNNIIEIAPLAFMRGRTFKNSIIIADEMQNSSPNQMKMLLTRIGHNSRMIITGDLKQTDFEFANGLQDILTKINLYSNHLQLNISTKKIYIINFSNLDILRSEIVNNIVNIYEFNPNSVSKSIKPIVFDSFHRRY